MNCIAFVTMYSLAATWVSQPEGRKLECLVSLGGQCLTESLDARAFYQDYPTSSFRRRRRSSRTSVDSERGLSELIMQLIKLQNETNQSARAILHKLSSIEVMQKTQTQGLCLRGVKSGDPLERVLLWGTNLALCDTQTDGGGWVVIQRRSQGDVDFSKDWEHYKNVFGTLDTDFWFGLDLIHKLTSQGFTELRVDLIFEGKNYFAHYSNFRVANETMNYKLSISGYNGTSGDSFSQHHGLAFTTPDRDNDKNPRFNCGMKSGWWFDNCYYSNLNGFLGYQKYMGPHWNSFHRRKPVTFTEMKVRQSSGLSTTGRIFDIFSVH